MKTTLEEKLEMCKEHVIEKKSLSHICEIHNYRNIDELKYAVNLYKRRRMTMRNNKNNV